MNSWVEALAPEWRRLRMAAGFCVLTLFSGCSGSLLSEPIGIGPDRDDLKQSPCACVEIPQRPVAWARI